MNMVPQLLKQCEDALKQVEVLDVSFPGDPAIASVKNQLHYLIGIELGKETDRSKLKELTLGRHAVCGLSNLISDDLSKLLCSISDSVRRQLRREIKS